MKRLAVPFLIVMAVLLVVVSGSGADERSWQNARKEFLKALRGRDVKATLETISRLGLLKDYRIAELFVKKALDHENLKIAKAAVAELQKV